MSNTRSVRVLNVEILEDRTTPSISSINSTASFASPSDPSSTADQVTILVEDTNGDPVSGLGNSDFSLVLSGGTSTGTFGPVSETSTPGTYTAAFTGTLAGSADTLTIAIDSVQLNSQPTVAVTAGPTDPTVSTASFAGPSVVSGNSDTLTIVAADAAGNPISGLGNSDFSLVLSGGTSTGTFGPVSETSTPGTYTAAFTGTLAGSADTLTIAIDSVQLNSQPTVTVTSIDPAASTADFGSPTDASGSTDTATIVVVDTLGNAVSGLPSSAFDLSLSGGTSTGTFGPVSETSTPGTYTAAFTGTLAGSADTLTVAIDSVQLNSQPTVAVTAGPVDPTVSTASFAGPSVVSGNSDTLTIVVADAAGNPISGLGNSDFSLVLSGGTSTGTFGPVSETSTPGTYTAAFTGTLAGSADTLTIAIDSVQLNSQPTVAVTAGPTDPTVSTASFAGPSVVSGNSDTLTIVAADAAGNPISGLGNSDFSLVLSGGTSTGTFGPVSETSTPGTYTAAFTGTLAGSADTLTIAIDSVQLNSQPTVTVTSIDPAASTADFGSPTDASGSTDTATIVVVDTLGNAVSGLPSSAFDLSLSGGTSTGTFGPVSETSTPGTYTAAFTGTLAGSADTLTIAIDSVQLNSQPTVAVTAGPTDPTVTTASFAGPSVVSGNSDTLTIVVADAAGNPISGLGNSDFSLVLSGGTSTGTFGPVSETSTPGTYTADFTGTLAGSAETLTIAIDSVQLNSQPTVAVTAGPTDPTVSTASFAGPSVVSGNSDTLTIVVADAAGNPISGLGNSDFSLVLSGGTSTGTFGPVTETSTPGTYTADFTGTLAGSADTLTIAIDSVQLNSQPTVTVTSIDPAASTADFGSPTDASGSTDTATIVVVDTLGNAVSGLPSSAFDLSLSGGTSTGTFGPVSETSTPGTYTAAFTGTLAGSADTLTVAIDSVQLNSQPTVAVTAGPVDPTVSTASFAGPSVVSGNSDTLTIVVADAAGNPISGLGNSDFSLVLSGGTSTGTFGPVSETSTPGTYTAAFTGTLAGSAETLTIAIDSVQLNSQPTVAVTAGPTDPTVSTASFAGPSVVSGNSDTLTIVVADAAGNPISGLGNSDFSLVLSGGTSTGTFGPVSETSTPGTYTAAFTGTLAGSADTLTIAIDSVQLNSQPTVTVTSIDPAASTADFGSPTDASGSTDTATIVVVDTLGNAVSGLPSSAFDLSLSGGTSTGTFGPVSETSTPGTYTAAFTGTLAGSADTLTIAIDSVQLNSQPTVAVTAGPTDPTVTTASFAGPSVVSGNSDTLTIVVADAAGNPISGLGNSDFSLVLSGGTSTGTFGPVSETSTPGTYTAAFTGTLAGSAETLTIAIDSVQLNSQPTVAVTAGPTDPTVSTASFAGPSVVSGNSDTLTIVVADAAGNPISGLGNSDFSLVLSGGTSTGTFGPVSETSTPGTYTAAFTGTLAGSADTLTIAIDSVQLNSQPTVTVTSIDPAASTADFGSPTDASGSTDTATIVVVDTLGNAVSGLPSSAFDLSLSGGTSTGTFGPVSETSTPGTYTAAFTGTLAGSAETLTVTVDGTQLTAQPQVEVTPGAASAATTMVALTTGLLTPGQTDVITMVVKDAAGNSVTSLTSADFSFSMVGGSDGGFGKVTETATPGTYSVVFTGIVAGPASSLLTNIDGVLLQESPMIQVNTGKLSTITSSSAFAAPTVASGTTATFTIVLEDAEGNPITGLSNSAFAFSYGAGTSTGKMGAVTETSTPGTYTVSFTGKLAGTARTVTVKVDGHALAVHPKIQVTPGAVSSTKTKVTVASGSVKAGHTDLVTISVKDADGNAILGLTAADFVLALTGSSTASFGTFVAKKAGVYTFELTGVTAGTASELSVLIDEMLISSQPKVTVHASA